jgi:DNA-binding NtrC family response regulator
MFLTQSTKNWCLILKHFSILIVDDEQRYAEMLAKRLTLRDLICETCHDGCSAIAVLKQRTFSLVILDLRLPDIYGIDVLAQIKQMRPKTAVIVLTGHGTEKDREHCMAQGAHAFMHKPLDIGRLMAIVAQLEKDSP